MLHLNNENFESEIKKGKVIVDFWAEWCGPCKMLGPIFETLSTEMTDIKFAKVNVDEQDELAGKHEIRGIPAMICFKDGVKIDMIVGALPKEMLKAKIEEVFK
jgi:thioredoxin 1